MGDRATGRRAVELAAAARRLWPASRRDGRSALADQTLTALEDASMSVQELAQRLAVERTVLTRAIGRLHEEGLVEPSVPAGRAGMWRASSAGKARQAEILDELKERSS